MSNLSRAMAVIEALVDEPGGVRVTDLATSMQVNRAIPHRILSELCDLGYVIQDPESERYRATLKVGSLVLAFMRSLRTSISARMPAAFSVASTLFAYSL